MKVQYTFSKLEAENLLARFLKESHVSQETNPQIIVTVETDPHFVANCRFLPVPRRLVSFYDGIPNNKIHAIREHRQFYNCSLKEAKDAVEFIAKHIFGYTW